MDNSSTDDDLLFRSFLNEDFLGTPLQDGTESQASTFGAADCLFPAAGNALQNEQSFIDHFSNTTSSPSLSASSAQTPPTFVAPPFSPPPSSEDERKEPSHSQPQGNGSPQNLEPLQFPNLAELAQLFVATGTNQLMVPTAESSSSSPVSFPDDDYFSQLLNASPPQAPAVSSAPISPLRKLASDFNFSPVKIEQPILPRIPCAVTAPRLLPKPLSPGVNYHTVSVTPKPSDSKLSSSHSADLARQAEQLDPSLDKRAQRLIKNRAAALESRKRKREQQQNLETQVDQLHSENTLLKQRVSELERIATCLTQENASLKSRVNNTCSRCAAAVTDTNDFFSKPFFNELGKPLEELNKRSAGVLMMTFFLSFAVVLFPRMLLPAPHIGGHISGKVYSDLSTHKHQENLLLDAPPSILYFPGSAVPEAQAPISSDQSPTYLPPATPHVESCRAIPLNERFSDMLEMMSGGIAEADGARKDFDQLKDLFAHTSDLIVQNDPQPPARPKVMVTRDQFKEERLARRVYHNSIIEQTQSSHTNTQPLQHQPSHFQANTPIPAIPLSTTSNIHLLPYRKPAAPATTPYQEPRACHGTEHHPRLSLIANLPASYGPFAPHPSPAPSYDDRQQVASRGGFLQLDLQVVDAKWVRWAVAPNS
ncbi:hypothetical protein DFS34DRAFT_591810 [Phlyctochytrium arcticum]|nr:hypothetical protein DFS34DRAFT_591810 [Phlyctochytrium arcticum]